MTDVSRQAVRPFAAFFFFHSPLASTDEMMTVGVNIAAHFVWSHVASLAAPHRPRYS
jgi:hypothetical protein